MLKVCYVKISEIQQERMSLLMPDSSAKGGRQREIGKWLLKHGIERFFGYPPETYQIDKNEHGKPYVKGVDNCFFNISHSGDYVACAFSDREVGLDIERIKEAPERVVFRYFHPNEIAIWEQSDNKNELFFSYWAAKESYLKYLGDGLNRGLSSFEVQFLPSRTLIREEGQLSNVCIRECLIDKKYKCFITGEKEEEIHLLAF